MSNTSIMGVVGVIAGDWRATREHDSIDQQQKENLPMTVGAGASDSVVAARDGVASSICKDQHHVEQQIKTY